LERISYDEAKHWFWIRTAIWTVVAALISMMAFFAYSNEIIKEFSSRIWISVGAGLVSTLLGLMAAWISMQFQWMRRGWRLGFVLNSPACVLISALAAFFICGFILSFLKSDTQNPISAEAIQTAYILMQFGIGASAFWGFIFGSWFSMRRDRYFVETI